MKKIYKLILSFLILFFVASPLIETAKAQSPETLSLSFSVHIEFGRRSRDCRGLGICWFVFKDFDVNATARLQPNKNQLQILFPMEFVKTNPAQFENDVFIQEEDFQLPKETSFTLGSDRPLLIPKGEYSLRRSDKGMILNIPQK
ncbi:MAG: hypothetical protein EYC69_04285 [Bacteroidetes bacterium]|nr:MAG: hypothetical protein EYC69_04285 [Bacteroidota bacterium]